MYAAVADDGRSNGSELDRQRDIDRLTLVRADATSNIGHVGIEFPYRDSVVLVQNGTIVSVSVRKADTSVDCAKPSTD